MLRPGRFRHRLLDDEFLQNKSPLAFQCLQSFLQSWQQKVISDAEIAAIYITVFSFLRRPRDFLGGTHNQNMTGLPTKNRLSCREFLGMLQRSLPEDLRHAKSLQRFNQEAPFLEFLCAQTWRSIPLSVNHSLLAWEAGGYPLQLLRHIPKPEEVLHMQAEGQRCVSMLVQLEEMQRFVDDGRDVLGFIVHDLIHADHFFADLEKAKAQILFSRRLRQVFAMDEIKTMMQEDPVFKGEFEYLMSDMNSVPLHLLKTFKAVLLGYFKRQANLSMAAPLPEALEAQFHQLYEICLHPWSFSREALIAAQRLNTPLFKSPSDGVLLHNALLINFHDEPLVLC